jgi:transposase InsO family protein
MRRWLWNWNAVVPNWPWSWDHGSKKTDDGIDGDPLATVATPAQQRRADRHDALITRIARTGYRRVPRFIIRAIERQRGRRSLESRVRRRTLARVRWARWRGWSANRIADRLGLDPTTITDWRRRYDDLDDRLGVTPMGAPPLLASPVERKAVLEFITLHGDLGLRPLMDHFPRLARRDLGCLLALARQEAHDTARGGWYRAITWHRPGAVWAMDHTEPPTDIDGEFTAVLTVRDLATGCTLAAHAVHTEDAASTIDLLTALFLQHGPPLVLKADNGSAFTAGDTIAFLHRHGVVLLRSPPYTPTYNGACEAGNGTVKHLTHTIACRHGRPGRWTLDDLEAARLWANHRCTEPNQQQTPEQRFAQRPAITNDQRIQLHAAIGSATRRRFAQLDVATDTRPANIIADALERQAIADALSGLGVYTIRSRPVRLPDPIQQTG